MDIQFLSIIYIVYKIVSLSQNLRFLNRILKTVSFIQQILFIDFLYQKLGQVRKTNENK